MKRIWTGWVVVALVVLPGPWQLHATWVGTEDFHFAFLDPARWDTLVQQQGQGTLEPAGGKVVFKTPGNGQHTTILPWKATLPTFESWYVEALLSVPGTQEVGDLATTGLFFRINELPESDKDGVRIRLENTQLTGSVTRRLIFEERYGGQVHTYYDQRMTVQDTAVRVKFQFLHSANMVLFCYENSPGSWLCVSAQRAKFVLGDQDVFRAAILASVNLSDEMEGQLTADEFFVYTDDQDKDFDGISLGRELQLGTSPTLADSDHDGLTDSQELDIYGTDPLVADTDGDALPDGLEVTAGGNPKEKTVLPSLLTPVGGVGTETRTLQIQTFPGLTYQLQQSTDLINWANLGDPIMGTGVLQDFGLGSPLDPNAFYRLQISD